MSYCNPPCKLLLLGILLNAALGRAQPTTSFIVVDQFGYLPGSEKIAVIRNPQVGFDAAESFTPGAEYALVDATTQTPVFTGAPVAWRDGATDASSGDKVWWFDFSSVTDRGTYYVLDVAHNVRSFTFDISFSVYQGVLRHAVRTFFYQRAGFAKEMPYAAPGWTDGASHLGPLQDTHARLYNEPDNATKEKDVSGGWYDAGDYNKYTNWTANYIVSFMMAYLETPDVWTDDFQIPESGNGIPDLLDEALWGLEHLMRLQQADGSVLSIADLDHASPPSSATGPTLYGPPSTSATLNTAAAFALAARVYGSIGMDAFAEQLITQAEKAWIWADTNPNVLFKNNDATTGTSGIGAGQQEVEDYDRLMAKLEAACFLFDVTGQEEYHTFIKAHYAETHLIAWYWASLYEAAYQETLLYYTTLPNADADIVTDIRTVYKQTMAAEPQLYAYLHKTDPYRAYLEYYGWGSNAYKALQGTLFTDMVWHQIDASKQVEALHAAEGFLHYLHGVNPMNITYLSNMYLYGGDRCVNEFYHTWYANGSALWDRVGTSTYGPPPGFLTGGPNPYYTYDACCPDNCGSSTNNAACTAESLTPPQNQPAQKSYKDFNTSWPVNSWEVTENSNGYQIAYIRLLAKYVRPEYDCAGIENGTAAFDVCHQCAGGTTGRTPTTDPTACSNTVTGGLEETLAAFNVYPNPTDGIIYITTASHQAYQIQVTSLLGKTIYTQPDNLGNASIQLAGYPSGLFLITIQQGSWYMVSKVVLQ